MGRRVSALMDCEPCDRLAKEHRQSSKCRAREDMEESTYLPERDWS
jgi:hypothetical protein